VKVSSAFLHTFASQAAQSGASIATGILIARGLGPAGQGRYALLVAAIGLLSTLACMGQFEGNVLTSAGERLQGRILLVRSLLQALVALVLLTLSQELWRRALGLEGQRLLDAVFVLVLVFEVLALLFRGINLGQHHIAAYNVGTLVQRVIFLVAVAVFAVARRLRVDTVLAAWCGAVTVNVFLSAALIWRASESGPLSWATVREGWGGSLARGFRALLTIGMTLVLLRTDVYMLGPMLGSEAVGQISVASTFGEYLWYISSILGSLLFAVVAASRGPETVARICRASRTTMAILAPVGLGLALLGSIVVPMIYGASYTEAGTLFVVLLPGMVAISLHLVIDSYFAGSGYPPVSYMAAVAAVVSKVGLNLVLVPWAGVEGAAVATSLVYVSLLVVKVAAFARETGVPYSSMFRPTWTDMTYNLTVARSWLRGV